MGRFNCLVERVQLAIAGSSLYYYGGQAITSASASVGNWTNALVSIDLSTSAFSPPLVLLQLFRNFASST